MKDIYLTDLTLSGPRGTLRVTSNPANEVEPVVAFNEQTFRTLVLFRRPSTAIVLSQLTAIIGQAPYHELLGNESNAISGDSASLAAQAGSDVFLASVHNAGNVGLGCIAGLRLVGTPAAGVGGASQPAVSPHTSGAVFLGFRRTDAKGTNFIRASILVSPPPAIPNSPPVACAGNDSHVVEGSIFRLGGSTSSDADGDALRWQWSRIGGGAPGDFFAGEDQRKISLPRLMAPFLGTDAQPITIQFELRVDDYRTSPPFGSADMVAVTVIPGIDLNPPIARAGADRSAGEDQTVLLDGSASSDSDGDPLVFGWTVDRVIPPVLVTGEIALAGSGTATPSFVVPRFASAGGIDIHVKLVVSSPRGGIGEDEVVVHAIDSLNDLPIADAGIDLSTDEGSPLQLDGLGSRDPNGGSITYRWELTSTLSFIGPVRETLDIVGADSAAPTITAQVFNERDLEFRLTVKDPAGLEDTDAVVVRVRDLPMLVTSIVPMTGSPGTLVTIRGTSLFHPNTKVYFGQPDITHLGRIVAINDSRIDVRVPSGGPSLARSLLTEPNLPTTVATDYLSVASGPVIVRKDGEEHVSAAPFVVPHLEIFEIYLSQGVGTYPLVAGKDAIVQVRVRAAPGPQSPLPRFSSAVLTVSPSEGLPFEIQAGSIPPAALERTAAVTRIGEAINFFIEGSRLQAPTYRFVARLYNNGIEIASVRSNADTPKFIATRSPRILAVRMVPFEGDGVSPAFTPTARAAFEGAIEGALAAFRRMYPMQGTELVYWPDEVKLGELLNDDGKVRLQQFTLGSADFLFGQLDGINRLADYLDTWNNFHPDQPAQFVVGFVEESLYGSGGAGGFAIPPVAMMSDIVKFWASQNLSIVGQVLTDVLGLIGDIYCTATLGIFCKDPVDILLDVIVSFLDVLVYDVTGKISIVIADFSAGATLGQEVGHNLGFVHPAEEEHDASNISHSEYDEDFSFTTFLHVPGVHGPVFDVAAPGGLYGPARLPKSVMSYAPGMTNNNAFLEPKHYARIWGAFRADRELPFMGGGSIGAGGGASGPAFRVAGTYSFRDGRIHIREARPAIGAALLTPELENSPFTLAFLDASGGRIAEKGFLFNFSIPVHNHGDDGHDGDTENVFAYFQVTRAIPEGTARVEVRLRGSAVWSVSALGAPPRITLLEPAVGGNVPAEAELLIRWSSSDPDGGGVSHTVLHSQDGGASFTPLALGIAGNQFRWSTRVAAGSDRAVVKVIASDGFLASEGVSGEFRLGGGKPSASILAPAAGPGLVTSRLCGLARAAGGLEITDGAAYRWSSSIAGPLGSGRKLLAGPLAAGVHRLRLDVDAGGATASAEIDVEVLADSDGDGTADAVEAAAGLDPANPEDVFRDEDGDGLSTGAEVLDLATDPRRADSDGDGIPNGEELKNGTSPTEKDTDGDGLLDPIDNCPSTLNADQSDQDEDGIGDVCDPEPTPTELPFRRSDSDGDGKLDLTDAVSVLSHLFTGGTAPRCMDAADADDSGELDLTDAVFSLNYQFLGGPRPPEPGPDACGPDPTADALPDCVAPTCP